MPHRRRQKASSSSAKKPASGGASGGGAGVKKRGGGANNEMVERLMKQANLMGQKSSSPAAAEPQLKGPTDAERQFPKLTDEQVDQFLADDGTFNETSGIPGAGDDDENRDASDRQEDLIADDDLQGEMPEPAPMDDVFGGGGASSSAAASATGGTGGLLGRLLDPDAGGKGRNRDGTGGLIAPPKPSGNSRQRLRAKIRAMREQRSPLNEQTTVRDANGRKLPGRMLSPEAVQAGIRPPKNSQIDQTLTAQKRKEIFESMKANMNQKREAQLAGIGAAPSAFTSGSSSNATMMIDDDSADIGI